jgi:ferredoxin-NADP reductase
MVDIESDKYKCFLFVCGGIGITPLQSVCNEIICQTKRGREIELCWFVWTCKEAEMTDDWFDILHPPRSIMEMEVASDSNLKLRLPCIFEPDLLSRHSRSRTVSRHESKPEFDLHGNNTCSRSISRNCSIDMKPGNIPESKCAPVDDQDIVEKPNRGLLNLDFLHTEFYLTKRKGTSRTAQPPPEQENVLRYGRPDLVHIFSTMEAIAKERGCGRVAVMTCGPRTLVNDVLKHCDQRQHGEVQFDSHVEMFDF